MLRFISWPSLAAVVLGLSLANSSVALPEQHTINRSLAAQGSGTNIQWSAYTNAGKLPCGTACRYWQRSAGRKTAAGSFTLYPSAWPGAGTTTAPSPFTFSLVDLAPTDETTYDDDVILYDTNYLRKSSVVFSGNDKSVRASVQKTGKLSTSVSYHVRVQNQAAASRDFFVRFKAPANRNNFQRAYEVGGPSGNEPVPVGDNEGIARSSAEVLVDGLPIWQTANSLHRKDAVSNSNGLPVTWGEDSADDIYTVYIGRYASGANFDLDYLIQADVETNAPDCGQDFYSYYPTNTYIRYCQVMGGGRELPPASSGNAPFEIYSTATLPLYYFLLEANSVGTARLGG